MKSRHLEALTFSLKAALSALIGVVGYDWAHLPGSPWVAAVSAVIVTQPTINSSLKASLLRVAANLGGAFCGLLLLLLLGHPLAAMTLGILIMGVIIYSLKWDDMLRPAFVAVILITLAGGTSEWLVTRNRVIGVLAGCACALVVGFLIDRFAKPLLERSEDARKIGSNEG